MAGSQSEARPILWRLGSFVSSVVREQILTPVESFALRGSCVRVVVGAGVGWRWLNRSKLGLLT